MIAALGTQRFELEPRAELLGPFPESERNWLEWAGLGLAGACGSNRGRVMDGGMQWSIILFEQWTQHLVPFGGIFRYL